MAEGRASFAQQVSVNLGRCTRAFSNERGWKNFISVALITSIIGMVMSEDTFLGYGDTKNGAFALVCACIWIGIFNSIRSICRERHIIRLEHRTGLSVGAYLLAHWLYEAMLCAAEAVVVALIVRAMSTDHFVEEGVMLPPLIEMYVTFFLIVFSADALGLLISSIVKNENTAMTVMPFALIIQLVMSGTIFELHGIADAISNITISRWGLDAICSTAHVNNMFEVALGLVEERPEMASTPGNLLGLWGILAFFAVLYAILSIVALSFVDKD